MQTNGKKNNVPPSIGGEKVDQSMDYLFDDYKEGERDDITTNDIGRLFRTNMNDTFSVTIRVGDVIEYFYNCTYGDTSANGPDRGQFEATVTCVESKTPDGDHNEFPLVLSTGHLLWSGIVMIHKIKELGANGKLVEVEDSCWLGLDDCCLEDGGQGTSADAVMEHAGRISDAHNSMVEKFQKEHMGEGPVMDCFTHLRGGRQRTIENVDGDSAQHTTTGRGSGESLPTKPVEEEFIGRAHHSVTAQDASPNTRASTTVGASKSAAAASVASPQRGETRNRNRTSEFARQK